MGEQSIKVINLDPLVRESKAKVVKSLSGTVNSETSKLGTSGARSSNAQPSSDLPSSDQLSNLQSPDAGTSDTVISKEQGLTRLEILERQFQEKSQTETKSLVTDDHSHYAASLNYSSRLKLLISDLYEISKPGILVLLLISTACPMVLAGSGSLSFMLFFWTMLGGALVSASASAMNCIYDRDIDAIMQRTKNRAIAAGRLSPATALVYSLSVGVLGLWVMTYYVNPLAAFLSLVGHLFYVLVYTVFLKRSTVQNIVIGGAAGSIPPLVGWAAVDNSLNLTAWLLFLVIFFWTPPHFWALAINKNSDYKKAKVPMLPVIAGNAVTAKQMLVYALILIPFSILLVYSDKNLGYFSLVTLTSLGVVFAYLTYQLLKVIPENSRPTLQDRLISIQEYSVLEKFVGESFAEEPLTKEVEASAWRVFKFSLIYLAAFFFCLVIDSSLF